MYGGVGRHSAQQVRRGEDGEALALQLGGDGVPAGAVGPCSVDEDDRGLRHVFSRPAVGQRPRPLTLRAVDHVTDSPGHEHFLNATSCPERPGSGGRCPRQDSNLRHLFRRAVLRVALAS